MPERVRFLSHGKDAVHPTKPEDFLPHTFDNGSVKIGKPVSEVVNKVVKPDHIPDAEKMVAENERDNVVQFDVPKTNRFIQGNDFLPPKEVFEQ